MRLDLCFVSHLVRQESPMGEYATYAGQEIKIGTCDSLLYLRLERTSPGLARAA